MSLFISTLVINGSLLGQIAQVAPAKARRHKSSASWRSALRPQPVRFAGLAPARPAASSRSFNGRSSHDPLFYERFTLAAASDPPIPGPVGRSPVP